MRLRRLFKWFNPFRTHKEYYHHQRLSPKEQLIKEMEPLIWVMKQLKVQNDAIKNIEDKDLREVVKAVYFLNDKLLNLSKELENVKEGKMQREGYASQVPFQPRFERTDVQNGLANNPEKRKSISELNPIFKIHSNDLVPNPEKDRLSRSMKFINQLMVVTEEILNDLEQEREEGIKVYKNNLKKHYDYVSKKMTALSKRSFGEPDAYRSLLDELMKRIPPKDIMDTIRTIGLLVDKELKDGAISKDILKSQSLRNKVKKLVGFINQSKKHDKNNNT